MNKKISWGLVVVLLGIIYLLEVEFPGLLGYLKNEFLMNISFGFFRFEFILLLVGLYLLIKRKIVLGIASIYISTRIIFEYTKYFLPLFIVFVGLVYIFLGIEEKNRRTEKWGK